MSPKSTQKKKETKAAATKRKAEEAADEADKLDKQKRASLFVTTIARQSSNPSAIALLDKYRGLPRYDDEKTKMIEMWGKDKSLKWVNNYLETKGRIVTDTQDVSHGYGTKCLTVL